MSEVAQNPIIINERSIVVSRPGPEKPYFLARLYLPKPIVRSWQLWRKDALVYCSKFLSAEGLYHYLVLQRTPCTDRELQEYHVNKGRITLPDLFLKDRRKAGQSIDARVARFGEQVVICAADDMAARARLVSMGDDEFVSSYAETITVEQLELITNGIETARKNVERPIPALTPAIFVAMFPGIALAQVEPAVAN